MDERLRRTESTLTYIHATYRVQRTTLPTSVLARLSSFTSKFYNKLSLFITVSTSAIVFLFFFFYVILFYSYPALIIRFYHIEEC